MPEAPEPGAAEPQEVPEIEWKPTALWPPLVKAALADLAKLDEYMQLMQSPGQTDRAYLLAMDFLEGSRRGIRSEIAAGILEAHGIEWEVPDADEPGADAPGAER